MADPSHFRGIGGNLIRSTTIGNMRKHRTFYSLLTFAGGFQQERAVQAQMNISQEIIIVSLNIGFSERHYLGAPSSGFSEGQCTPWVELTPGKY